MASMRFGTLQLCDEHACKSATKTSTEVAHFYAATWTHFTLRLTIAKIRSLLEVEADAIPKAHEDQGVDTDERDQSQPCPKCGGAMIIIETFMRGQTPKSRAPPWEDAA